MSLIIASSTQILILVILISWIIFSCYWLIYRRNQLTRPDWRAKYGSLITGFKTDHIMQFIYISVYSMRRLALALCLFYFDEDDRFWQIITFILIYSANLLYLAEAMPHEKWSQNMLNIFNEAIFIFLHYMMFFFIFGDYVNPNVSWNAGTVSLYVIGVLFLINVSLLGYNMYV